MLVLLIKHSSAEVGILHYSRIPFPISFNHITNQIEFAFTHTLQLDIAVNCIIPNGSSVLRFSI